MKLISSILWFVAIAAVLFAVLVLLMYWRQDQLIFFPQPLHEAALSNLQTSVPRTEPFELRTADSVVLKGWLLKAETKPPWPLVMYFGGNAEETSWVLPDLARLPGWAALVMNYRGYGHSEGSPSERALFSDALEVYDSISRAADIDAARIVPMGRSLGTGVATYLASERPVAGIALVSPYDSLTGVASSVYPFVPVRWLLKHKFDSLSRAPKLHMPLLVIAGELDTLIPPERSRRLAQAWGGPAEIAILDAVDHNTVHMHPRYWVLVEHFLRSKIVRRRQ